MVSSNSSYSLILEYIHDNKISRLEIWHTCGGISMGESDLSHQFAVGRNYVFFFTSFVSNLDLYLIFIPLEKSVPAE